MALVVESARNRDAGNAFAGAEQELRSAPHTCAPAEGVGRLAGFAVKLAAEMRRVNVRERCRFTQRRGPGPIESVDDEIQPPRYGSLYGSRLRVQEALHALDASIEHAVRDAQNVCSDEVVDGGANVAGDRRGL